MIRSSSSSSSVIVRQSSSSQASRMQSITTSSVRRYQKAESSSASSGGWYQQFSTTSMGHPLAGLNGTLTLTQFQVLPGEILQKLELVKTTQEDHVLTRQQIDYILHEIKTMTEEEVKVAHAKFMEICPDGKMTREMFANVLQEVFSEGNASSYCQYAFKLFDRDNNGTLSFTEFVFAMQIYSSNDLEDSLGLVFDIFDSDRSGTIDKKEIIEMIVATSALTCNSGEVQDARSLAEQIMASCDIRRSGKITKTEFINGCKNVSKYCRVLVPGYDEDDEIETTTTSFALVGVQLPQPAVHVPLIDLLGEQLLQHSTQSGSGADKYMATRQLHGKIIGLYFSGHWCPPSRTFTPKLAEAYKTVYNDVKDKFDVVFVSSDKDQDAFDHYYKEMPWKALPFSDRTRKNALTQKFNVTGIPRLVILSSNCEVLVSNGVADITTNAVDAIRRWSQEFHGESGGESEDTDEEDPNQHAAVASFAVKTQSQGGYVTTSYSSSRSYSSYSSSN